MDKTQDQAQEGNQDQAGDEGAVYHDIKEEGEGSESKEEQSSEDESGTR